ncbi:MAG: phosphate ABC transporter permease subunit PstC [Flavobacteriales bacterium]
MGNRTSLSASASYELEGQAGARLLPVAHRGGSERAWRRAATEKVMHVVVAVFAWCMPLLLLAIAIGLAVKAMPLLSTTPLMELLTSAEWRPLKGQFGFLAFIVGTIEVTLIAVLLAVPFGVLSGIYLSEHSNKATKRLAVPVLDMLGAIPSVIFGIWGVVLIVPMVRYGIAPFFGVASTGYTVLTGGLVLSVMVFPLITQVVHEVVRTVPNGLRDAGLALGATNWETTRKVVVRKALPGIWAACILGFSRAFGETIAVLMVVGNVVQIPWNPLQAGYPIPALIANNYGEMMSIPMYDSALMFSALLLLAIVLAFNLYARRVLKRMEIRAN